MHAANEAGTAFSEALGSPKFGSVGCWHSTRWGHVADLHTAWNHLNFGAMMCHGFRSMQVVGWQHHWFLFGSSKLNQHQHWLDDECAMLWLCWLQFNNNLPKLSTVMIRSPSLGWTFLQVHRCWPLNLCSSMLSTRTPKTSPVDRAAAPSPIGLWQRRSSWTSWRRAPLRNAQWCLGCWRVSSRPRAPPGNLVHKESQEVVCLGKLWPQSHHLSKKNWRFEMSQWDKEYASLEVLGEEVRATLLLQLLLGWSLWSPDFGPQGVQPTWGCEPPATQKLPGRVQRQGDVLIQTTWRPNNSLYDMHIFIYSIYNEYMHAK